MSLLPALTCLYGTIFQRLMRNLHRRSSDEEFNIWPAFTDVITGIFLFMIFVFIILVMQHFFYAVRLSELEKFLGKLKEEMDALEREFGEESNISIDVEQGRIVLEEQVLFDFGKANLKPESRGKLEKLGRHLKGVMDRQPDLLSISIDGHTDNVGGDIYNLELGANRAIAVLHFLTDDLYVGMDPRKYDVYASTHGEYRPVKTYTKETQDKLNRRIEIRIIPKFDRLLNLLKESN